MNCCISISETHKGCGAASSADAVLHQHKSQQEARVLVSHARTRASRLTCMAMNQCWTMSGRVHTISARSKVTRCKATQVQSQHVVLWWTTNERAWIPAASWIAKGKPFSLAYTQSCMYLLLVTHGVDAVLRNRSWLVLMCEDRAGTGNASDRIRSWQWLCGVGPRCTAAC